MCGIAGKVCNPGVKVDIQEIKRVQQTIRHRGPDGQGLVASSRVTLAVTRLSIIDVEGGNQPLYNEDSSLEIVGNGEIYNYVELQKELKKKGHTFKTGSDIETVVHAYEQWGVDCASKLRGMFAMALYDRKKEVVILFRDRMGEKPLYYTKTSGGIVFASEMKALLKAKGANKDINWRAIDHYFHYYYIPEPETAFSNVKKLPAGSLLIINLKNMSTKENKYWDPTKIIPTDQKEPTRNIKETFAKACELTLRSDVPVGISLSGGIDSGSILAFSAPKYKDAMKAFCIGYEGLPPSDERKMARELAQKFKVEFIEEELRTKDAVKHFPYVVWGGDDPIADIAGYAIYSVAQLARQNGIKVLLGGLGGDELFWGYPATVEATLRNIARLSQEIGGQNKRLLDFRNPHPQTTGQDVRELYANEFVEKLTPGSTFRHLTWNGANSNLEVAKRSMDLVRDLWLKSDPIILNDRLSMAASVELRSPFLDHCLVEAVLSSIKAVEGYKMPPKYWFKKAMEGVLPKRVMMRPKRGFTPPVSKWLTAIIKKYIDLLENGFLIQNKIIDKNKLKPVLLRQKTIPMYSLYQLILLEIWGREYVFGVQPEEIK